MTSRELSVSALSRDVYLQIYVPRSLQIYLERSLRLGLGETNIFWSKLKGQSVTSAASVLGGPWPQRRTQCATLAELSLLPPSVDPLDWRFPSFCVLEAKPSSFRIMVTAPGPIYDCERSLFSRRGLFLLCISASPGKNAFPHVCGLQSLSSSPTATAVD
jgi:hypothetical protein